MVGATGHECRRTGQDYFAGMAGSTSGLGLRAIEKEDVYLLERTKPECQVRAERDQENIVDMIRRPGASRVCQSRVLS